MKTIRFTFLLLLTFICGRAGAQIMTLGGDTGVVNYASPREYTLSGVDFEGIKTLDKNILKLISGLAEGDKITIPGDKTADALDKLWNEGLFDDIQLVVDKTQGDYIWLKFIVTEKSRIRRFNFTGVSKSEADDIRKKINIATGRVLTDYLHAYIEETVTAFYQDKGYKNCKVTLDPQVDTANCKGSTDACGVFLHINVKKGSKVKISDIFVEDNLVMSDGKIRRSMKDTKRKRIYNIFKSSKYLPENLVKDKENILKKYYARGYRDAAIVKDSVYATSNDRVAIKLVMSEGHKYYYRNITWVGNTKYSSEALSKQLGIKKGDVYDQEQFEARLFMNAQSTDVTSLYMDDGYLFFQLNPVEVRVVNDSIDFEMRIYEGRQATIRNVTVVGNTKTNDRVIMREIRTRPGYLFRRTDIIRTQRELASLGYFNPETVTPVPKPDAATGTVDIEYNVEERPSDQLELSGGWGANRIVGTLGVSFNNFSTKNFFNGPAWTPLPSGDGQKLSVRAQSNGLYFQSYNASFTEPWLGGRKPNSLTFGIYHSVQSNGQTKTTKVDGVKVDNPLRQDIQISGGSVGFGMRLKKPDDFFQLYMEGNYQYYQLHNYASVFTFANGYANNLSARISLSRDNTDQQIYPRHGSSMKLVGQFTPPYSLWNNKNYSDISDQERYKWLEYYKWKFTSSWFTQVAGNLVLNTRVGFGYLGTYQKKVGESPFERFYLGGSGLTGFSLDGREIIALRGYDDQSVFTYSATSTRNTGQPIIAKYTMELRYPVSLNPSATVYGLAFAEGGKTWSTFKEFNPFDVYRSAGVGVRVFLPMFGLLGLDWGYRLDTVPGHEGMQKSQIHFSIGLNLGEL